jgi:hypothetical protein
MVPSTWLPISPPDLGPDLAGQRTDLAGLRELGIYTVMLVTSERHLDCPTCARLAGRMYALERAPSLPPVGCAGACSCQLAPLSLE